jgi:hypothetical protein
MEAICSSETWGYLRTTLRQNPEDCGFHNHLYENLKSNK